MPVVGVAKGSMARELLSISLVQMRSESGARDNNVTKACEHIDMAAREHPDVIVLPEMFNTEYFPQYWDFKYMDYAEPDDGYTITRVGEKARQHNVYVVATIFEQGPASHYYDTAMLIGPEGNIVGKYRKVHPSAIGSLEKIYFRPGSRFHVFEVKGWRVGISICYDNWFPESARCLALNGAELIIAPFATERASPWENVLSTRAIDNELYLAACNHVGKEGEITLSGKSIVIDPFGEIVAMASATEEEVITVGLDRDVVLEARRSRPFWRDRVPEAYKSICMAPEDVSG